MLEIGKLMRKRVLFGLACLYLGYWALKAPVLFGLELDFMLSSCSHGQIDLRHLLFLIPVASTITSLIICLDMSSTRQVREIQQMLLDLIFNENFGLLCFYALGYLHMRLLCLSLLALGTAALCVTLVGCEIYARIQRPMKQTNPALSPQGPFPPHSVP